MFSYIDGVQFPKKLLFHVCSDHDQRMFYHMSEHLIPLGETKWPEPVKDRVADIFKEIGIKYPLKQKLVEPFACAFGGIKDDSGDYKLDSVNWEYVVDYFRWEAQAISEKDAGNESHLRARELQEQALKKYGSIFHHYLVYANPDYLKPVDPNM